MSPGISSLVSSSDSIQDYLTNINSQWVVGVDEAGRGAWAGPLCLAVVVEKRQTVLKALTEGPAQAYDFGSDATLSDFALFNPILLKKDSKQLSAKQRVQVFRWIRHRALWSQYCWANPKIIADLNINGATYFCLQELMNQLPAPFCNDVTVLMDGSFRFSLPNQDYCAVIQGDRRLSVISQASIIAKVMRDRLMTRMQAYYPGYGFSEHKGYGTLVHRQALQSLGVGPIHRKKYAPIAKMLAE